MKCDVETRGWCKEYKEIIIPISTDDKGRKEQIQREIYREAQ